MAEAELADLIQAQELRKQNKEAAKNAGQTSVKTHLDNKGISIDEEDEDLMGVLKGLFEGRAKMLMSELSQSELNELFDDVIRDLHSNGYSMEQKRFMNLLKTAMKISAQGPSFWNKEI